MPEEGTRKKLIQFGFKRPPAMFGGKDGEDAPLFQKARNPRRPRDAPDEDAVDAGEAKSSGGAPGGQGAKDEDKEGNEAAGSKPGRRRRRAGEEGEGDGVGDAKSGEGANSWMTSPEKRTQISKLIIEQDEMADDNQSKQGNSKRDKFFSDGEQDDILMIPDLDEDGADADQRVAHAPRNVHRKIPSLADLESEVKQAVASVEEGYDLSILLRTLVPPTHVQEIDAQWTFESLMREVTDELTLTPKTVVSATISSSAAKESSAKKVKSSSKK